MLVRRMISLGLTGVLAIVLAGCDGGGDLKEGVPQNIDMAKSYTPAATVGTMSPKDFTTKKAAAKAANATPTPAPDAK